MEQPQSSQVKRALFNQQKSFWAAGAIGFAGIFVLMVLLYFVPEAAVMALFLLGVGIPIVYVLWHHSEFGLIALLFLATSFIPADTVDIRLPIGGGMDLRDLTMLGVLGIAFFRELTHGRCYVPWPSVGGPLTFFLLIASFSAFYALTYQNVEINWALGDLRILMLYTTFFVTLWSIRQETQFKILLAGLFLIADLTAGVIYLQQFVGADNPLLEAMTETRDWRVYQQAGAVRVMPAGQMLMHFMWFVALGMLLFTHVRSWRFFHVFQLIYLGGGHILTYTRAQWLAMLVGIGLVLVIFYPRYKNHLVKATVVISSIALIVWALILVGGAWLDAADHPFIAGIVMRFGSLFTPGETAETGSLQWRTFETETALASIYAHPWAGVGLGGRYRSLTTLAGEANGNLARGSLADGEISRFTRYIHNSYLAITVKMGLPGLVAFLWFCAAVLVCGFQYYLGMPDSYFKGVVLGAWVGFASLPVWCYFHAHLIKAESTGTIGVLTALVSVAAVISRRGTAAS